MDLNKKYFGMTVTQLGILGGLAALVVLLFCIVGFLVLGKARGTTQQPPTLVPIQEASATLIRTPTLTPTATLTPIPYEALIPSGWVQHKTELIEIWLPENFKVANPKILGDTTGLAVPALVLTEAKSKTSLYQMISGVSYEPLVEGSLDEFLDTKLTRVSADIRVVERRKVTLNSTEAIRVTFEYRDKNVDVNDVTFIFLDGSTIWYVEYAAQINEFFDNLAMFETSAKTFRVVK